MIDVINTLVGAVAGAIAGGVVTLLLDKRKERREDKERQETIFKERPELSIVGYEDNISNVGKGIRQKCDIEIFVTKIQGVEVDEERIEARYDLDAFNTSDWCCAIYTLKNAGLTDISCLTLYVNEQRRTALFNANTAREYAQEGILHYAEFYDRKIRVGESITLKVCYNKNSILCSGISAPLSFGLEDSYGRVWEQPFWAPEEKVYDSRLLSRTQYRANVTTDVAIECFKNSGLW